MTVSLEMVLPGLAGYWLDKKLGTKVLFMLLGFAIGCTAAVLHLIQLTRTIDRRATNQRRSDNPPATDHDKDPLR